MTPLMTINVTLISVAMLLMGVPHVAWFFGVTGRRLQRLDVACSVLAGACLLSLLVILYPYMIGQ